MTPCFCESIVQVGVVKPAIVEIVDAYPRDPKFLHLFANVLAKIVRGVLDISGLHLPLSYITGCVLLGNGPRSK
jgi:hypothetical protein